MTSADFQTLIDDWQLAYGAFFRALDTLPYQQREQPGLCGGWNARQVIAHMSGWHQIALARFEAIEGGDPRDLHYDIDMVNADTVAARSHLDWTQSLAELRVRIASLYDYANGLIARRTSDDPRFCEWLQILAHDAREHTAQITAWTTQD